MRFILLMLLGLVQPALAESKPQPLAVYQTDNGTVPPEFHWHWRAEFGQDGALELTYCRGYDQDGPGCARLTGQVTEGALDNIRKAALASGLLDNPAREAEMIAVGGGQTRGRVMLEGRVIDLLAQPADSDRGRVEQVLNAILAEIPKDLIAAAEAVE